MSLTPRTLGLVATAGLLVAPLAPLTGAQASPIPTADQEAAVAAADYVVAHITDDNLGDPGGTADGILALLAVGGYDAEVEAMTDWLETQAEAYAGAGGPAAGKVALVAAATGRDATDFGGVDLVAAVEDSIGADGTCGGWGYAFGQALCILGPVSYTHLTLPTNFKRCRSRWSPYH